MAAAKQSSSRTRSKMGGQIVNRHIELNISDLIPFFSHSSASETGGGGAHQTVDTTSWNNFIILNALFHTYPQNYPDNYYPPSNLTYRVIREFEMHNLYQRD
jgi:hypothetical protein